MLLLLSTRAWYHLRQFLLHAGRLFILFLPAALLLIESLRQPGKPNLTLWLGTGFQFVVCLLALVSRQGWRQPIGPSLIVLYIIALSWLWLGSPQFNHWFPYLARAVLLVVPLGVFALQTLIDSGAIALRRAHLLAQGLANRSDWPTDLGVCRGLPEVKALRAAIALDATPALALLQHPRPQVQAAALAALEFRKNWRPGEAEMVLQLAQRSPEPGVRALAITALGNVDDYQLIESLTEFLRDRSWEVRKAATEALLWDTEHGWTIIRDAVRRALADPQFQNDGALRHEGQSLTAEAVKDLNAWATEKGILGQRAALTLAVYYGRALGERSDDGLVSELREQLANPQTPAVLRMELARLLHTNNALDEDLLEKLLTGSNPAPLRLIAAEAVLAKGEHPSAVSALHDLARLPNREIALATADVVQRRLGIDLGLALGQPLPPVHSRLAAQVARRVLLWATPPDRQQAAAEYVTAP